MTLHKPTTPIPSPQRGRGGAMFPAGFAIAEVETGHLPPPCVGEGRGGGALPTFVAAPPIPTPRGEPRFTGLAAHDQTRRVA